MTRSSYNTEAECKKKKKNNKTSSHLSSVKNAVSLKLSKFHSEAILRHISIHRETKKTLLQCFRLSWVTLLMQYHKHNPLYQVKICITF